MGKYTGVMTTSAEFKASVYASKLKRKVKSSISPYVEQICQKLDLYHSIPKYQISRRQEILIEIISICSSCAGPGLPDHDDLPHIKAIKALGFHCNRKIQREQKRAQDIEQQLNTTGARGLRGAFRFEKLNKPGLPGIRGDDLVELTGEDADFNTLIMEFGVKLSGNDAQDYYMLKKLIREARGKVAGGMTGWGLIYMDSEQRSRYKLKFTTNTVTRNGTPYTTVARDENIYAASPAGEIFACSVYEEGRLTFREIYERMGFERKAFMHHTSFLSGADVLCAGTLLAAAGRLLMISNLSGHYKPDINDLQAICAAIIGTGYDPKADGFAQFWDFDGDIFPHLRTTASHGNPNGGNTFQFPLAEFAERGREIRSPERYAQDPIAAPIHIPPPAAASVAPPPAAAATTWVTGRVGAGPGKGKEKRRSLFGRR